VVATKIAFVLLRSPARSACTGSPRASCAAPAAGIAAGYAYSWGAIANGEIEQLDVRRSDRAAAVPVDLRGGAPAQRPCARRRSRSAWRWRFQLANNWVHAATAPLAVLGLALVATLAGLATAADAPWRDLGALARR
jgi:hypothetical protein